MREYVGYATNKQERLKEMRYQLDQSLGQVKGVPIVDISP